MSYIVSHAYMNKQYYYTAYIHLREENCKLFLPSHGTLQITADLTWDVLLTIHGDLKPDKRISIE